MSTGEGSFASDQQDAPRVVDLPERRFAVRTHDGDLASIDATRREVYQFMIMNELVAGPSVLRFRDDGIDVMVGCVAGFDGTDDLGVETAPAGPHAVFDYEGPEDGLLAAHDQLRHWVAAEGRIATGPLLQVHMMDPLDGDVEQQLQLPVTD